MCFKKSENFEKLLVIGVRIPDSSDSSVKQDVQILGNYSNDAVLNNLVEFT